jgi:ribonucleotide reductase alpha subunit
MTGYSYSQVFEASIAYFEGDEFAAKVFVDKYALQTPQGEYLELTPTDMHHRLAKEFARIEAKYPNPISEDVIFSLLDHFTYIVPQGSPMSAIGNPYQLQSLSNCFVVQGVHSYKLDSYGGIMLADQEIAQIMKRRGGVGLDISGIRPKDTITNNAAKTTDGIAVFMERYSNTCREVAQNGRRGALMITISVNHPEILTFIKIKRDKNKVTGANISIRFNDEFMNAVKNDQEYTLRFPVDVPVEKARVTKVVKAKDIWEEVINSAWASAEPGLLFWDTVKKNTPSDIYHEFGHNSICTNPCFSGDTLIAVADGRNAVPIKQLAEDGKDVPVYSVDKKTGEVSIKMGRHPRITGYNKKLVRIILDDGSHFDVTPDHKCLLRDGTEVLAKDLQSGSSLPRFIKTLEKASKLNNDPYYMIYGNTQDYHKDRIFEHRPAKQCAAELGIEYFDCDPRLVKIYQEMLAQGYYAEIVLNQVLVQKTCEVCRSQFQIDHLHRESSICSVECKNLYLNFNQDIKAKRDASRNSFNENKMQTVKTEQARVYSQLKFDLGRDPMMKEWEAVCKVEGLPCRIGKTLKFGYKNFKEVAEAGNNYNHKVVRVEDLPGDHIVYNITVDDNHTLAVITGHNEKRGNLSYTGVCVSQCGEIILPKYDACRLMCLNLASYVANPFTKNAVFDFKKFHQHTLVAQRLMDDIIDLEIECVDRIIAKVHADPEPVEAKTTELTLWKKIREMNISGRRTGLGITALGDALAMLGIKYGSIESIETTRAIYRSLSIGAHTSSCIMAKERGSFPIFDYQLEKDHVYLNSIFQNCSDDVKKMWGNTGRRNIALTTTAPTGSVSSQTQTTSGIEPAYMLSYIRRKKHNPSDKNARVDFVDALGDSWQEFTVYHHGLQKWMEITGETDITQSPYYGATSNDIDWVASVDLQAAAQESIDHSISKTCNLPENIGRDVVSQVYMRAWERGCKGFTVYRDKCRDGVLIQKNETKKGTDSRPVGIEVSEAPKRPQDLPCEIKKAKIQGEQWTIFVGLLNGKPYEVFGGLSKYVDIPNKYKMGKIVKNGKVSDITTYNLIVGEGDDQMTIRDIANIFENANFGAFTRTISLALRHGAPIQYVVEQLQKDKYSEITSFSKVIARVLKSYIQDGTKSRIEKTCPSCSKENSLAYQEGCLLCINCGFSKC